MKTIYRCCIHLVRLNISSLNHNNFRWMSEMHVQSLPLSCYMACLIHLRDLWFALFARWTEIFEFKDVQLKLLSAFISHDCWNWWCSFKWCNSNIELRMVILSYQSPKHTVLNQHKHFINKLRRNIRVWLCFHLSIRCYRTYRFERQKYTSAKRSIEYSISCWKTYRWVYRMQLQ